MIYALIIMDPSGNPIYSWKHPNAPKKIIKKFVPDLTGSFITAILNFGAEILNAPRYIDMGIAGMAIVNLRVKSNTLIAAAIADKDDSPIAIERFIIDFKNKAEGILVTVLSISSTGLIIISDDVVDMLNKMLEAVLNKHVRWLAKIRSSDKKSFLLALPLLIPIYFALQALFAILLFRLFDIVGLSEENAFSLFLIAWMFIMFVLGSIAGWITTRPKTAFFAGMLAFLISWLIYAIPMSNPVQVIGGSVYSVLVGIFAYIVASHFDNIYLVGPKQ